MTTTAFGALRRRRWTNASARSAAAVAACLLFAQPLLAQTPQYPPPNVNPNQAFPTVPAATVRQPVPLSIADAMARALAESYDIRMAQARVDAARAQLAAAKAGLLPTVAFTTTVQHTVYPEPLHDTPYYSVTTMSFGLTLDFTASSGGVSQNEILVAQADLDAALADVRLQRSQVISNVRQTYADLRLAQEQWRAAVAAVQTARDSLSQTEDAARAGKAAQEDVDLARRRLDLKERKVAQTLADIDRKQQNLNELMNAPESFAVIADDLPVPPAPQNLDALIERALRDHPEIAQLSAAAQAARIGVDLAKAGWRPDVTFSVGPSLTADDTFSNLLHPDWTGVLSVSIPIFDGGATRAAVNAATHQLREAELALTQRREAVRHELHRLYSALRAAAVQLPTSIRQYEAAQAALERARQRLREGKGSQQEVAFAEEDFEDATVGVTEARAEYYRTLALIDEAVGIDDAAQAALTAPLR
ncbi:MAG: TolC family protein [bacterium]